MRLNAESAGRDEIDKAARRLGMWCDTGCKTSLRNRAMDRKMIVGLAIIGVCGLASCGADMCKEVRAACCGEEEPSAVDQVLKRLNERTVEVKSYEGQIEYRYIQPLLESQTLRKGVLYYAKSGEISKLRMNFETLKQDDEEVQKYIEHFVFDGVWLRQIDYQLKAVKCYQFAEPNKPADAFAMIKKNMPLIGFTKTEDLKKQFEIELMEPKDANEKDLIHLHLKVRPDSIYKDDYKTVDFWIDKKLYLPTKVVAVTTAAEGDMYQIRFLKPKVNVKLNEKLFEAQVPRGFSVETVPLEKKSKQED
jgi:outer membrane lipoprotein-sorting protein